MIVNSCTYSAHYVHKGVTVSSVSTVYQAPVSGKLVDMFNGVGFALLILSKYFISVFTSVIQYIYKCIVVQGFTES